MPSQLSHATQNVHTQVDTYLQSSLSNPFNPFTPKLIIQILPTIQEENDWVM